MKKPDISERDWMTVDEVAEACCLSKSTVLSWIRAGKLKAQKVSTRIFRIPKAEVEEMQKSWTDKA